MQIGKLSNELLNALVLDTVKVDREDVLIGASTGEDCAALSFGSEVCVLSTDPITGTAAEIGKLAVNIGLNDIASSGAKPVALLMTLMCPESTSDLEIAKVVRDANETASKYNVAIIGGHTERTSAVTRIVVSMTAIGKTTEDKLIKTGGANAGDFLYMTKWAGLEGTGIIAYEKEAVLKKELSSGDLEEAFAMLEMTSVIKEGEIAASCGATAMHDVTEGGILGAVYEMCEASGLGCEINKNSISIKDVTERICDHFIIDPLRLISSGSMLIAIPPDKASCLEVSFVEQNIPYSKIGTMTEEKDRILIYGEFELEAIKEEIPPPERDELYKVLE